MQIKSKEINTLTEKVKKALASQNDIAAVYLFGSYGTEFQNEYSDIDLGIVFISGVKTGLRRELELEIALSLVLETDHIDLINLNRAPIQIRHRAISEGRLIYEADYITTSNFLEDTYRYYLDFAYHLGSFNHERSKALKEAYING